MNGLYLQWETEKNWSKEIEKLGRNECTLHHWRRSPLMKLRLGFLFTDLSQHFRMYLHSSFLFMVMSKR